MRGEHIVYGKKDFGGRAGCDAGGCADRLSAQH